MKGIFGGYKPILGILFLVIGCSAQCKSTDGKADRACSPGVTDSRVTQDTIKTTICVKGYTGTVRPAESFTEALKRKLIKQYGYKDTKLAHYELDHIEPLEVGGSPDDVKNLFPQPRKYSGKKDQDENRLHREVCSGKTTLADAQEFFRVRWTQ